MTIAETAESLLTAVVAGLSSPPTRQVITVGVPTDPLATGDQLGVGFVRTFAGVPGRPEIGPGVLCWGPRPAEFVVRLVRCIQTSTSAEDTSPGLLTTSALAVMDEAAEITAALYGWKPPAFETIDDIWIGDLVGERPAGHVQRLQVLVQAMV